MTFISYAQNFEDVMLWRALKHIDRGFYIDIGAAWPNEHSVTKAFYEHEWRGINIEPNKKFHQQLLKQRRQDRNLCVAVADHDGSMSMNFLGETGLSTLDDTIAEKHQQAGWNLERQVVNVMTLATIWQQYVATGQDVHFLKVDVEGMEESVLRGNEWSTNRPWIVVVESTLPLSQDECYEAWEHLLLTSNYRFVYADGLNRFYIASERSELLAHFKYPPNVFDDFKLSSAKEAENCIVEAEARAVEAEARAVKAEARSVEAEARALVAEVRVQALQNSLSWRITAPLRNIKRWIWTKRV